MCELKKKVCIEELKKRGYSLKDVDEVVKYRSNNKIFVRASEDTNPVMKAYYDVGIDVVCNIICKTCNNRIYCGASSKYYRSIV